MFWSGTRGDFDVTATRLTPRREREQRHGAKAPIAGVYEVTGGLAWSANAAGTRKMYLLLHPADASADR